MPCRFSSRRRHRPSQSTPTPLSTVPGGFVGGLLLGFLLALLAERLDDRIRDSAQLADATGTHFVPEMSKGGSGSQPQRLEQEAVSYALAHASLVAGKEGVRSVLVVAATLGDRRPTSASASRVPQQTLASGRW